MITTDRAKNILRKARRKNVLALGDIILDGYLKGAVERFSQEAPVPVISVNEQYFFPGGAGNSAACMSEIGIMPHLFSVTGQNDSIGYSSILKKECLNKKIIPYLFSDPSRKTTFKLRVAAFKTTNQHIARIDIEDTFPLSDDLEKKVIRGIKKEFAKIKPKVISLHDYKKGFFTENIFEFITELSQKNKIPVFADLKQNTFVSFRHLIKAPELFFLKPNRNESVETAKLLNGFDKNGNSDEEINEIARIIQDDVPVHIIITRGAKGAVLYERNKQPYFIQPKQVEEQFDVAGAGDTVEAFLIASYLGGAKMEEALEIAVAASQVAIRKFGTSVVSVKELSDWLEKYE